MAKDGARSLDEAFATVMLTAHGLSHRPTLGGLACRVSDQVMSELMGWVGSTVTSQTERVGRLLGETTGAKTLVRAVIEFTGPDAGVRHVRLKEHRADDPNVVGWVHSHPVARAVPSTADRAQMSAGELHLVVGRGDTTMSDVRAWRRPSVGGSVVEVDIVVHPAGDAIGTGNDRVAE